MMSPENIPSAPDTHSSGNRKASSQRPSPQEQPLKCPRCDSANTKFCYYNNYSLSQPRHFCKTCRRYWTRGGALRNVPIGGGCRKTKKIKSSNIITSSLSSPASRLGDPVAGDQFGSGSGSGFKFTAPAMEFQLGGLSLPRLHPATAGVYTQFITSTTAGSGPGCFGLDLLGLNHPLPPPPPVGDQQISISSIESLSSINQEMHWKLQQQRLAMIYDNKERPQQQQQAAAINLFQNLEIHNNPNNSGDQGIMCGGRKSEVGMSPPTEWFFDHNQSNNDYNTSASTTATNSCNDNSNTNQNVNNGEVETAATGTGSHLNRVQAAAGGWTDFHHFHGLQ